MSRFESAYATAVAQADTASNRYDFPGDEFNSPEIYSRFADIHASLVVGGFYANSMAYDSSGFVRTGRACTDARLSRLILPSIRPVLEDTYDHLEAALDDGEDAILVQPRFDGIDPTKTTPDVTTASLIKFRTQVRRPGIKPASFADRGTNGGAEAALTPEVAEEYRASRRDELLALRRIGPRQSLQGYRSLLVADVMHKVNSVVDGENPLDESHRLQVCADYLLGQTLYGHGATGPEALFYVNRRDNSEVDALQWILLANGNIFTTRAQYYSQIASTVKHIGTSTVNNILAKTPLVTAEAIKVSVPSAETV